MFATRAIALFIILIESDVLFANWTPLPTRHSKLLSLSPPDAPSLQPKASHSFQEQYPEASNHFPLPVIEPHANGATVGLDLPHSNLRLLLDFDELASKPIAKHIGYKVIEREPNLKVVSDKLSLQHNHQTAYQASNMHSTMAHNHNSANSRKHVKHVSIKGSVPKAKHYEVGFIRAADLHTAIKHRIIPEAHKDHKEKPKGSLANHKLPENFKVLNSIEHQSKPSAISSNRLTLNAVEMEKFKPAEGNSIVRRLQSAALRLSNEKQSANLIKGVQPRNYGKTNVQQTINDEQQKIDEDDFSQEKDTDTQAQEKDSGGDDFQQTQEKDSDEEQQIQQKDGEKTVVKGTDGQTTTGHRTDGQKSTGHRTDEQIITGHRNDGQIITGHRTDGQKTTGHRTDEQIITGHRIDDEAISGQRFDGQKNIGQRNDGQKTIVPRTDGQKTVSQRTDGQTSVGQHTVGQQNVNEDISPNTDNDDFFEDNEKSARLVVTIATTNAHQSSKKMDLKNEKETETEKEDAAILKPFPKSLPLQGSSCPTNCISSCAPNTEPLSDGSLSITETATALECGDFVNDFPAFATIAQNLMDLSVNGYTIFLPTNNAYSKLPKNLIDHFKQNPSELNQLIENHFVMSAHTLEDMRISSSLEPRALNAKLRITSTNNLGVTVNGQRIVLSNQKGPQSGVIHTIDGLLYPIANKDIMNTLKTCNRFDGFVTLAEGTGISDILSKGGPYSVFVPSNEALQKIPDSDLNKIRSNLTALKDFLRYHISPGSHFSSDLRDAQFIPTLLSNNAIKTGVRVDGCARNLVEANVSPLYRADIPASNGVIHVLDWVLKPEDHDWCEGVLLPR